MDGKRKKIADVEAEWEEKIAFFSSQIEQLTNRIEKLEQHVLKLESGKESNKTLEKYQNILNLKGKKLATFSKEKIYPVLHTGTLWIWRNSCKVCVLLLEFFKIKVKKWGYTKTAIFSSIAFCILLLLFLQPWQGFFQKESASIEKKDSTSPMASAYQEEREPIKPGETQALPRQPEERHVSQTQPEERIGAAIHSPKKERNDLPLITSLIQKSQTGEMDVRMQAIEALGKMNNPSAAHQLCQLLKDPNTDIRWYSLRNLSNTKGDRATLQSLMEMINDSKQGMDFQREAMRTLANLGGKFTEFTSSEKKFLLDVLLDTSKDEELRSNAAFALSNIGYASISGKIVPLLDDPSPLVREMVAYTLGSFLYPNADKELVALMKKDDNVQVRLAVAQALGKIDSKVATIAPELFEQWKKEPEECVKKEIQNSLKRLSRASGFPKEIKEKMERYMKE